MTRKIVLEIDSNDSIDESILEVSQFISMHPHVSRERIWVQLALNSLSDAFVDSGKINVGAGPVSMLGTWGAAYQILGKHVEQAAIEIYELAKLKTGQQ